MAICHFKDFHGGKKVEWTEKHRNIHESVIRHYENGEREFTLVGGDCDPKRKGPKTHYYYESDVYKEVNKSHQEIAGEVL